MNAFLRLRARITNLILSFAHWRAYHGAGALKPINRGKCGLVEAQEWRVEDDSEESPDSS